jgi:hypothetical protein
MQTFVPYADFQKSAKVLDYRRLGKQRVETLQLVRCNLEVSLGWKNHPAAKMWANNINGLIAYGVAMCDAWLDLGYKDTCRDKLLSYGEADANDLPFWWGDEAVHSSHRSNLLRKDLAFYSQWGWTDDPAAPYIWPEIVSA